MTQDFEALGTHWWITIFDDVDEETSTAVFGHCTRFVSDFEAAYSRFKFDSLITNLNKERSIKSPSNDFRELLTYGKQLYLRTNTRFNLLSGHILEAHGYDANYSFKPTDSQTPVGNPVTDLAIDENGIALTGDANVDVGGYGKGYLIDQLATLLTEELDIKYFLINGGGDMYASSNKDEPVEIYLAHPTKPKHIIQKTTLLDQGFASSSPFKRAWRDSSKTYSHIVSSEAVPQIATFIKASTAKDADAFATSALLMNEPELAELIKTEYLEVARFNPETDELSQTRNFTNKISL